jgi:hypothetical protein
MITWQSGRLARRSIHLSGEEQFIRGRDEGASSWVMMVWRGRRGIVGGIPISLCNFFVGVLGHGPDGVDVVTARSNIHGAYCEVSIPRRLYVLAGPATATSA